jgi:TonB-linked SusC/RagA family outer membrane protein
MVAIALTVLLSGRAAAQGPGRITGIVKDAQSGAPLSEVHVYLAGVQLGSMSRANGRFAIPNVAPGTYDLTAKRIGYSAATRSVTVAAGDTVEADFELSTEALALDEIVVTGTAGTARRREVGNSISQINVAKVLERPASTTSLLQGAVAGVELTGGDGQLGQGKQIRLRGVSSISMTHQPLIYVDGVRMMDGAFPFVDTPGMTQGRGARVTASPLDNINPNDIERIEVIKGSAATTLYGTEASAGVIQIFTKRGSVGAPVWTAEVQQGTGWAKKYGVNGVDYLHMEHFLRGPWWGSGYEGGDMSRPCITDGTPLPEGWEELERGADRWQGVNRSADGACRWPGAQWYQTYNLSVRGGAQALQYYLSGLVQNDVGMLPLDRLKKYNVQGNFRVSPLEGLQIQWSTGFTRQWQQNTPSGNNLSGVELQIMRQERNYFTNGDPQVVAQALDYDYQQWIERLTTGATITYTPFANFTNRVTIGYDYAQQEARNLMDFGYWEFPDGSLVVDVYQKRLQTFDYVASYNVRVNDRIRATLSAGGQAVGNDLRRVTGIGQNFPGAAEPTVASASLQRADEDRAKVWNAGFFFQNLFDIADRYFLTTGVRVDGNSAFGEGFGLQVYPKVSAAWVISDESFWPARLGSVKLRTAYGQSGRAPGTFDAVRTWEPVGFLGDPAFRPENRGNPDLGPEVTGEFEAGFDASWFNDRITATFTYFNQVTRNALLDVSSLPSLGFSDPQLENVGKLGNKGIELQLEGAILDRTSWGLNVGLGISTNHSRALELGEDTSFNALGGRVVLGQPVPVAWGRRVANPGEIGPWVYENDGENVVIGPAYPTHFVTPSITLRTPGNIILNARGEYRGGHFRNINPIPILRSVRSPLCFPYYVDPANDIKLKDDTPALWRERCTPAAASDYWWDADYFKLRSVSATVPVDFAFPQSVSNATLTLSLDNAWDWYREIPWYDIEILGNNAATSDNVVSSTERTPAPATLRLSLRVTF